MGDEFIPKVADRHLSRPIGNNFPENQMTPPPWAKICIVSNLTCHLLSI